MGRPGGSHAFSGKMHIITPGFENITEIKAGDPIIIIEATQAFIAYNLRFYDTLAGMGWVKGAGMEKLLGVSRFYVNLVKKRGLGISRYETFKYSDV